MELQKLIYTVEDGVAVVTMNYMKNLNAIDELMADELMYVVDAAEKDPNVKVDPGRRRSEYGRPDRKSRYCC